MFWLPSLSLSLSLLYIISPSQLFTSSNGVLDITTAIFFFLNISPHITRVRCSTDNLLQQQQTIFQQPKLI